MTEEQIRWPDKPNSPVAPGWTRVLTPLGASLDVLTNSPAWDVCTEWQLLHSGRGLLAPTDPRAWFSHNELSAVPQGLVAELYAHASCKEAFTRLVAQNVQAREHMLRLPDHLFGAEPEEWTHVGMYVDLAHCFDARAIAQAAANETSRR